MNNKRIFTDEELHYLRLLSRQYPTVEAAGTEIIRLQAILNLPKPTEHFMSDIHGEHEAFLHILNSGSGEVKEKLEELFGNSMTRKDRNDLATLIYYPTSKLALVADEEENLDEWYRLTIHKEYKSDDAVEGLDVSILQREILQPLFAIEDPKTDLGIDFVGGIRGLHELERRVNEDAKVAFSMYPTSIQELFSVADQGKLMPPKSTWFEPKLRSGLFLHSLS